MSRLVQTSPLTPAPGIGRLRPSSRIGLVDAYSPPHGAQNADAASTLKLDANEGRLPDEHLLDRLCVRGLDAARKHGIRLGDLQPDDPALLGPDALAKALAAIEPEDRAVLERTAKRIRVFAQAQRESLETITVDVPGGQAGHWIAPVQRAGCYVPGGRFPLPSSVLMTAVTARVAGVEHVWVASPRPAPVTLAAAAIAGADGLLAIGGAQAIGAFAYGAGDVPACDVVVGPGNRWVTAAKQLIAGLVAIDMLAGPSELMIIADSSADPAIVAADLLAQAEHDTDARASLVAVDADLIERVEAELSRQLSDLPTAETARAALANGFAVLAKDINDAVAIADCHAPEHLEVITNDAAEVAAHCRAYGAIFIGPNAAEVLGDYGIGPNHTLPTGGTARSFGGLSVLNFLRVRTWLRVDDLHSGMQILKDTARLARMEGLEGHARSAERRGSILAP